MPRDPFHCPAGAALTVDLYELTMMQVYFATGLGAEATFDLFVRSLPGQRNFLLAAGVGTLLELLEDLRFSDQDISFLASTGRFTDEFLHSLASLRFTGDVDAMPEGTVAFALEPLVRITAPVAQAQYVETMAMNQVHLQTLLASKAARVVLAADGRGVVDFGLRRVHGAEAGLRGARAFWIAGVQATSNVLAGQVHGIPITGTMAHSFVQSHDDELEAFRAFTRVYPETVLLVDTYDTLDGVDLVIRLARELGDGFAVRGIRLDSGDLAALARAARARLDRAGLQQVQIFASGGLDEYRIRQLLKDGAPIDAFGVGTNMVTSADQPSLDAAYKLAELGGRGRLKLSSNKDTWPGVKQVWRRYDASGRPMGDVVGEAGETADGEPLLVPMMRGGRRLEAGREPLSVCRERAARQLERLPERLRALDPADPPYPVTISDGLEARRREVIERLEAKQAEHRRG